MNYTHHTELQNMNYAQLYQNYMNINLIDKVTVTYYYFST